MQSKIISVRLTNDAYNYLVTGEDPILDIIDPEFDKLMSMLKEPIEILDAQPGADGLMEVMVSGEVNYDFPYDVIYEPIENNRLYIKFNDDNTVTYRIIFSRVGEIKGPYTVPILVSGNGLEYFKYHDSRGEFFIHYLYRESGCVTWINKPNKK
jgi:hypothetical protein